MKRTYEITITCGPHIMQTWLQAGSPQKALAAAVEEDSHLREALRSGEALAVVKVAA